jgi:hypothetical protein
MAAIIPALVNKQTRGEGYLGGHTPSPSYHLMEEGGGFSHVEG